MTGDINLYIGVINLYEYNVGLVYVDRGIFHVRLLLCASKCIFIVTVGSPDQKYMSQSHDDGGILQLGFTTCICWLTHACSRVVQQGMISFAKGIFGYM